MDSRRGFLKSVLAAGVAPVVVPRSVLGGPGNTPPSERLTVGGVGIGGVGHGQIQAIANAGFQVVALCDVDDLHAKKTYDKFPQARKYRDFREMLSKEGSKIDAVYCGTPDHTHAIVTLAALAAKKHVCCVKPLTRSIEECRMVVDAAKRAGVATQVTADPNNSEQALRIKEYLDAGVIGDVVEVHAWSNRPVWPQGMLSYPDFTTKVPQTLDWDLWLGPAQKRPFADKWPGSSLMPHLTKMNWGGAAVYHPFNFRGWYEFGSGALGDMGCHRANTIYKVLNLTYPTRVSASSTKTSSVAFPLASSVTYDFPKRGSMPALRLVWYDGGILPPVPQEMGNEPLPQEGVLYIGTKGKILHQTWDGNRVRILDPKKEAEFSKLPRVYPRKGHVFQEWHQACKGGEKPGCSFDWALYITEFVLLGNLAIQTGAAIEYDSVAMRVPNNPAANALLRIPYHNGWKLK